MASVAIVPAAGKGERFGGPKLLADVVGQPLLNWTLKSLLEGGVARVVVVAAPGADFSSVELGSDPRVRFVVNDDPSRGMFSSIQVGLATVGGDPILFLPADMPFVSRTTVAALLAECRIRERLIVPVHQDKRGHPIAIPNALRRMVMLAPVTSTLKDALAPVATMRYELPVDDPGIHRDVDIPPDLQESQKAEGRS
jgi:molybdenum cofactor cytidylyltransferase